MAKIGNSFMNNSQTEQHNKFDVTLKSGLKNIQIIVLDITIIAVIMINSII